MSKLKIFLKSGHTIDLECDDWEFKRDSDCHYTGYNFKKVYNVKTISIDPCEIAGYIELKDEVNN